jgi:endonuclease/exonuclease/phosphatase family metal-dependent hydrolase
VHVYATHLDYRTDPTVRARQVDDTLRILAADRPGAHQVLLGDLNATPRAPELAPLWDRLTDVWGTVGTGSGRTYPASDPTKRIDYVTVSRSVAPVAARVPVSDASDHLPVVTDLAVPRGGPPTPTRRD